MVTTTNSLILILPPEFDVELIDLFQLHFDQEYGKLVSWTVLWSLSRVLLVYESVDQAIAARREMDGFIWEE